MKKRILSILLSLAMVVSIVPVMAFATEAQPQAETCNCETKCTAEAINAECAVCGAENADLAVCIGIQPQAEPTAQPTTQPEEEQPTQPQQLMYGVVPVDEAELYNVWVGGVQVTSDNKDDITAAIIASGQTATGEATYNPTTKTLTLDGFVYSGKGSQACTEYGDIYNAAIVAQDDLNIVLIGANSIDANKDDDVNITNCYGIYVTGNLDISGDKNTTTDSLTLSAEVDSVCSEAGSLTVNNTNIIILKATTGLKTTEDNIKINNAVITMSNVGTGIDTGGDRKLLDILNNSEINITAGGYAVYNRGTVTIENSELISNKGFQGCPTDINIKKSTVEVFNLRGENKVSITDNSTVNCCEIYDVGDFNIENSTLNVLAGGYISVRGDINITDSTVNSNGYIQAHHWRQGEKDITIEDSTVTANTTEATAITGNVTVKGDSTVTATGAISAFSTVPTLDDYKVSAGNAAPGTVVDTPTDTTYTTNKYVKISPKEYGIWIGKTQITTANKDDITAAINDGSNGTASGIATYDPETNTLTFRDFTYSGPSAVNDYNEKALYIISSDAQIDNFTFKFYGNNTLSCTEVVGVCGIVDVADGYIAESGALGSSMTFMFAGGETGVPSAGSGVKIEKGTSDKTTSDGTALRYVKLYSELPPTSKHKSADGGMDMIYADGKEIEGFDRLVFNYTLDVPYEKTSVTFTGKMSHSGAWADNLWEIPLNVGENVIAITTTAEDGKTNWCYTITVNRGPKVVQNAQPTPAPTAQPTVEPTVEPTTQPTATPTPAPTATPAPTSASQQTAFPWWIVAVAAVATVAGVAVAKKKRDE